MAYRFKYFAPAVLYVLLIITLSSLNQRVVTNLSLGVEDFILHATEYHLYGLMLIWAILREKPKHDLKVSYRLAVGVGALSAFAEPSTITFQFDFRILKCVVYGISPPGSDPDIIR